mmetsp:Transcript_94640/g.216496  ORF Transcript_94640/g.216496 Transcript_94640/m.216496 type:complete len:209 (-) Transcript_94640:199-825(-)
MPSNGTLPQFTSSQLGSAHDGSISRNCATRDILEPPRSGTCTATVTERPFPKILRWLSCNGPGKTELTDISEMLPRTRYPATSRLNSTSPDASGAAVSLLVTYARLEEGIVPTIPVGRITRRSIRSTGSALITMASRATRRNPCGKSTKVGTLPIASFVGWVVLTVNRERLTVTIAPMLALAVRGVLDEISSPTVVIRKLQVESSEDA